MLPVTPELLSHLSTSTEFRTIELFRFTLIGGTELKLSNHDRPYENYVPAVIQRSMIKRKKGLEMAELTVTWTPGQDDTVLGHPVTEAALLGAFDDAEFEASVVFMGSDWTTVIGSLTLFSGWVAGINIKDWTLEFKIKNLAYKIAKQVPRGLYTAGCQWRLYDTNCGVNKAAYAITATVESHVSRTVTIENVHKPDGWFDLGVLVSGGYNYNIMRHTGTTLLLSEEPLIPLDNQVVLYPGCNLTKEHCENKFNNFSRFRGFLWIPEPEVAMFGAATTAGPLANIVGAGK